MTFNVRAPNWSREPDSQLIAEAARLVYQANPEYYRLLGEDPKTVTRHLETHLKADKSELSESLIAYDRHSLIAIACFYPTTEMAEIQIAGLTLANRFLEFSSKQAHTLRKFRTQVPVENTKGMYLSRFSVNPEYRRLGLGNKLLSKLEDLCAQRGYDSLWMHVYSKNKTARLFYESLGYQPKGPKNLDFAIFLKTNLKGLYAYT